MTAKNIEYAVVVQVGHVAGLHEHGTIVEIVQLESTAGADAHQVYTVIAASGKDVLDAIVVHVTDACTPLIGATDGAVVDFVESSIGLVQDVDILTLVENDHVIEAVVVDVNEANGASTVEGAIEHLRGDLKRLRLSSNAECEQCAQQGESGLVHPCGLWQVGQVKQPFTLTSWHKA